MTLKLTVIHHPVPVRHPPTPTPQPSCIQAAILLTLGLQQREVSDLQQELNLPSNQVLALFNKAIRKLHGHLRAVKEAAVERQLPRPPPRATPSAAAQAGMSIYLFVKSLLIILVWLFLLFVKKQIRTFICYYV
jgi:hypothetical protein